MTFPELRLLTVGDRDEWRCWLCGLETPRVGEFDAFAPLAPSLDHIIPVSKYGSYDITNLRLAHRACNMRRGNRDPKDIRSQQFYADRISRSVNRWLDTRRAQHVRENTHGSTANGRRRRRPKNAARPLR